METERQSNQIRPFNLTPLKSDKSTTRLLYESKDELITCEIVGPQSIQANKCEFRIDIQADDPRVQIMKQNIDQILHKMVFTDLYFKQSFQIKFEAEKGQDIFVQLLNTLSYGLIQHGIRIRDTILAMSAVIQQKGTLQIDSKENKYQAKMELVYAINKKQIVHSNVHSSQVNSEEMGRLLQVTINGVNELYSYYKDMLL